MTESRSGIWRKVLTGLGLLTLLAVPLLLRGQFSDLTQGLRPQGSRQASGPPAEMTAVLVPTETAGEVLFKLSAKLPPEHYLYSMEKSQGAATRVKFTRHDGLEPIDDDFVADHEPKKFYDAELMEQVEKFYDKVTWTRRYRLTSDAAAASIAGQVNYQVCDSNACRPLKYSFDVKLAQPDAASPPRAAPESRPNDAGSANASRSEAGDRQIHFEQMVGPRGSQTIGGRWTVSVAPREVAPGGELTITVAADLQPGWHVYALDQQQLPDGDGPAPTAIGLTETGGLDPLEPAFKDPEPITKPSEAWLGLEERFHEGRVEWTRRYRVPENAPAGDIAIAGKVAWTMCNSGGCQPAMGFEFQGTLRVSEHASVDAAANSAVLTIVAKLSTPEALEAIEALRLPKRAVAAVGHVPAPGKIGEPRSAPPRAAPANAASREAPAARFEVGFNSGARTHGVDRAQGLGVFLLTAVLAGFAALLTPCVFPMIPITVSFFQKQSEKQHHRPITMALVYCLGIVGTFTGLGMLMSVVFSAAAITQLANNVPLNLLIACILIFFAFNLLGLFEIRMPSWLLTYTAGQESRGGFIGVLFMALTFTLTSFTCTFAFAGGLLVAAQYGDRLWPILGLLAFSAAFSLPFFFLALFPSFLQKLPKSGGWMNVVKVIMGLIELGAAFKFFGTADQAWNGQAAIFDFHLMVSAWAVISIGAALYLLGLFRLSHDLPTDHIGVVRFVSAMSFMGLAAYLGVGLFSTEKPQGMVWKYIEAFATPTFKGGTDPTGPYLEHGGLKYALDFERAFEFAVAENKPLFLDFTGVNCTNCRYMEKGPMSQPAIEERLSRFVRVQLFTDVVPIEDKQEAERLRQLNVQLQENWFGDVTLPSYVVIPPDRAIFKEQRELVSLTGKNSEADFARFLDTGWKQFQTAGAGRALGQR